MFVEKFVYFGWVLGGIYCLWVGVFVGPFWVYLRF